MSARVTNAPIPSARRRSKSSIAADVRRSTVTNTGSTSMASGTREAVISVRTRACRSRSFVSSR